MRRHHTKGHILCVCLALLVACGGGGSGGKSAAPTAPVAPPTPEPAPAVDTSAETLDKLLQGLDFLELANAAAAAIALRDPESVVADGLSKTYGLSSVSLTNISFSYQNTTADMWQVIRDHLDGIDPISLSQKEQSYYTVYSWQVDQAISARPFMHFDYQASYFLTSVPRQTQRFFSDLHPLTTLRDAKDYLERLVRVDTKFDQLTANLQEMERRGVIEPAITLRVAIDSHRGVMNAPIAQSPYYQRFSSALKHIPGISDTQIADFKTRARDIVSQQIKPAYQELTDLMQEQLNRAPTAVGVGQFPDGKAYYRERLRYHTTTSMTPEQIHDLGHREVKRVRADLRKIFESLGYPQGETLEQSLNRVATAGGTIRASDSLSTYESLIDDATMRMAPLFNRLPDTEVIVIGGDSGGFYIRASLDGSRPGAFYAGTSYDQPYYLMPSLAYHEAMPGHHMQIASAQEAELPLFRRTANFTGFVEGWALYAERLASDYDWYEQDVYGDIGRLYFEALRAVRLVVDTGIHYYGWSFEKAVTYFQTHTGSSRGYAESNIARYSIYTGQATAYMVGMLKILELREQMKTRQGDAFSIIDFHSQMLENGSMPLDILEQSLEVKN